MTKRYPIPSPRVSSDTTNNNLHPYLASSFLEGVWSKVIKYVRLRSHLRNWTNPLPLPPIGKKSWYPRSMLVPHVLLQGPPPSTPSS